MTTQPESSRMGFKSGGGAYSQPSWEISDGRGEKIKQRNKNNFCPIPLPLELAALTIKCVKLVFIYLFIYLCMYLLIYLFEGTLFHLVFIYIFMYDC